MLKSHVGRYPLQRRSVVGGRPYPWCSRKLGGSVSVSVDGGASLVGRWPVILGPVSEVDLSGRLRLRGLSIWR